VAIGIVETSMKVVGVSAEVIVIYTLPLESITMVLALP
jgi:hypothetical protein